MYILCTRSSFSRHHPTLALKQIKIKPNASLDANQQKAKLNKQSKRTELFGDPFLLCYIGCDLVVFVFCFFFSCFWQSDHALSFAGFVVEAARISALTLFLCALSSPLDLAKMLSRQNDMILYSKDVLNSKT